MRLIFFLLPFIVFSFSVFSQNGKIVEQKKIELNIDSVIKPSSRWNAVAKKYYDSVDIYRITYLSDGLLVKGYMDMPKKPGKYPCIIYNRGGNRNFGKLDLSDYLIDMAQMATWGYCVVGSQYRGNDGGEGAEEFGGKDVDDVINMIPLLNYVNRADTSRIGMWGVSRGGMMTYMALTKTQQIKAAVVLSGLVDLKQSIETRKDIDSMLTVWLADYRNDKERFIKERSALQQADLICKSTPIFIIQGTSDWRVTTPQVLDLSKKFYDLKQPFRLSVFEGADHGVTEFMDEVSRQTKIFFDDYLRDKKKWPSLEQHGE
jgi:dipeptidyl aminopeptidase/acylaminoacyl peptidase